MFFSGTLLALLVSLSAFAWSYSRFMRTSGQNTPKSAIGAGVFAAVVFVTVLIFVYFLDRYLNT